MKNYKTKAICLMLFLGALSLKSNAQVKVGDNPTTINSNSALEIESTSKGLLNARVALASTSTAAPLSSHLAGMMVYNTATVNDVVPGLYINDGTKWLSFNNSIFKSSSYYGKVVVGDIGGNATPTFDGFIVTATKSDAQCCGSNVATEIVITHNLNIIGKQNIQITYLSNNIGNDFNQYKYDNDFSQPLIHDITPNSFRIYVEENQPVVQNVSYMIKLTEY